MLGWKSRSWFYPKPTGDPGRDRNARSVQFACFLLAFSVSALAILDVMSGHPSVETGILFCTLAALVAAMVTNRAGNWEWAARTAFLAVLLTAMLLVFEARDGFRSLAMLLFPSMLLISVMLLDRASYMITAGMILVAVAALGIAEKQGLTRARPHVRTSTTYESIFFVDLNLLVFAVIGSRIASDAQNNVFDLRATIDRVSKANLTLEETAEALRESEQQLVSIYNTVRDDIFYLAVEPEDRFRFVSVNAAFLRVTGLSREAVIGKTVNEVIPEPSTTMVLGKYRQAIEENTTVVWEETSDDATGRLNGEVSVGPIFDRRGNCTHLVGSVHDITERKQAEEALRRGERMLAAELDTAQRLQNFATQLISTQGTEALYEQILDTAVAILHSDLASIQMFYPERGTSGELRLLGHRGFSVEAAKRWEWVRPTTRTTCGEALRTGRRVAVRDVGNCDFMSGSDDLEEYLDAGIHAGQSTPLVSRSGLLMGMFSTYWREPHELSAAEFSALDVLARMSADLIERSRTEEKLRESEERFRRVFEEGPLGLGLVGRDYHFQKVNGALCQMVGYSEAELLQKTFVDITHPDDLQTDVELAQQVFRGEKPFYKLQKRYMRKNGEIIWINLTGSVIRDKEGEPLHGLAMIEDITDFKRAQDEVLARQKIESVGVLARGVAHDFNNLLGGITASTELALMEHAEGSAVEEHLQRIKTASLRGAEIVRELMIYGGEESSVFEPVDISALVNEMLQLLKVSISKPTTLKTELGQNLPPVHANPAQIRQVVMNLVTNASEAIGTRAGEIRVTSGKVRLGPNSPVRGSVTLTEGDYLRLEVVDSGSGMTPEVQARIFDPFFSTKRGGRGLGLAAVQGIIRSHGGTINVESASGQGSRFEILLPFADQAAQDPRDITAAPSASEAGSVTGTVLVVEDEEMLRIAVSKMLRKRGFSVIEAGDGTTGVKLFRANERDIDVVLLDFTLPEMSGREVLEELRRIRPSVKVIFTSAFSQDEILSSISQEHFWGYIRKPYQVSELTSQLRIACLDKPTISGNAAS